MYNKVGRGEMDADGASVHPGVVVGWFAVTAALLSGPFCSAAQAQGEPVADADAPLVVARLSGEIELDGVVDEPAWDAIEPPPMTMYTPVFRGALTEETEIRVAHDDRFLYVSGRMWDSEPNLVRTNTFYRDQYSGDDIVAVVIDSYNDYETAVWFVTNPAGVRSDRAVSNDAQFTSGMPMNQDWNSYWDVETSIDHRGWYAEFRIPFSTLGFQAESGEVTMGLISYRLVARKNERQTYPAVDPKWGGLGFARPSLARRIVLRDVRQSTPLYVTPYTATGFRQEPYLPEAAEIAGGAWQVQRDPTAEAGIDVKYSPTSNLALDLTANTDFAQVEADDQQINLTRFALFFPEKRQFFQERASTFDFNTGGGFNRLFHSRQIGLHRGEIVRIYGGARAVGRIGGMDYGVLNMQTAAHGDRSSENMGVLRVRQQVFNPYSTVGGMLTTRLGTHGGNNVAYGLDGSLRLFGDEYVLVQWAHTFDQAIAQAGGLESGLVRARWERRRDEGFSYQGEAVRAGRHYLPGLGFQLRRDFSYGGGRVRYRQFRDPASPLRSRAVNLRTAHYYRNAGGAAESREIAPEVEFEFRGGARLSAGVTSSYESVREEFSISDAAVLAGEYWFHEANAGLTLGRSRSFRGQYDLSAGSFYGGTRYGLSLGPVWSASKYVEVEAGYEVNRIDFSGRDAASGRDAGSGHDDLHSEGAATTHLGRLRLRAALDPRASTSAFVQYNSATRATSLNVRFRYHFREGTDLWIVYNEGLDHSGRDAFGPRRPLSSGRAVMVKYSHSFAR